MSVCEFERIISAGNGYVSRIKKGIKPDRLETISLKFPRLNIQWLLTGEGEMLLNPQVREHPATYVAIPVQEQHPNEKSTEKLKHIIRTLEQDIGFQQQTINYYRKLVSDLSK